MSPEPSPHRSSSRAGLLGLTLAVASLHAPAAAADEAVCHASYVEAQRLQRSAQLRAARRAALACGQDECSPTVRVDCVQWLESISKALPSIVVDARDALARTLADVRVEVDGELLAERLDGRAIALDPGQHRLRFTHAGQSREQHTLIHEGVQYRPIQVRFEALGSAGESPAKAGGPLASQGAAAIPSASYALGGVGLLGLGVFGTFAVQGYQAERDLRQRCQPSCARRDVRAVRRRYLVADIGLGGGVAALAAALAVWYWRSPEPGAAERGATNAASRFDVSPRGLSWSGAF